MGIYELKKDLKVFCVRAVKFPNDIGQAFGTLIKLLPTIDGRIFFGVSYQDLNNEMIYNAAVLEDFDGEGKIYGCETFTIKKGEYLSEMLKGWKKNEASIGLTFRKMSEMRNDTVFPCVEWYQGEDVLCMVRIDPILSSIINEQLKPSKK
jgi:hypothetical protein